MSPAQQTFALSAGSLNPFWQNWADSARARAADGYTEMIDELRALQDSVARSVPSAQAIAAAREALARARALLAPFEVDGDDHVWGRLLDLPGRAQTLAPPLRITRLDQSGLEGAVVFGQFHAGSIGTVHGGAVALLFDDALGRLADLGTRSRSRTAGLRVDYRNVSPLGEELSVHVTVAEETGRKRFLRGRLCHGDTLCAEAEGLFVALRDGQR